jgi:CRISPR/Cas system CSM-associated protein Csm2 small subunit
MAFAKKWKTTWELKSLTQAELFSVIVEIITKQLDDLEKDFNSQFVFHFLANAIVCFLLFFNFHHLIHSSFLPTNLTINF